MSAVGSLFFALMALLALAGAVATIASRNPIRSAIGLLVTIVGIAGLFLKLNAQFMSAIQLIVYAGAVVVLFVFVIMLLGPDADRVPAGLPKARLSRVLAGLAMAVFTGLALFRLLSARTPTPLGAAPPEHGSVEQIGRQLFTAAIVPFELATALLIVAVIGAIAVARPHHTQKAKPKLERPSPQSFFHGPLHPRDAGHPLKKESA